MGIEEAVVLSREVFNDKEMIGLYCKKYPTRELLVFLTPETKEFAIPGKIVKVNFTRAFNNCKSGVILDSSVLELEPYAFPLEYATVNKGVRQVVFKESVFFVKDETEDPRVSNPDVHAIAYSATFGFVPLLKRHVKTAIEIDPKRMYKVKIATGIKRLSQANIDKMGSFVFCIEIVEEFYDLTVFNFLAGVIPFKRSLKDILPEDQLQAEVVPTKLPDAVAELDSTFSYVFPISKKKDGVFTAYYPETNDLIEVNENHLIPGHLYQLKEIEETKIFFHCDGYNQYIKTFKNTYELEIAGELALYEDKPVNFPWTAYVESPFGDIVFAEVPKDLKVGFVVQVKAVFYYTKTGDASWFVHRYCNVGDDCYTILKRFTVEVMQLLEEYEKHSQFCQTPSNLCPDWENLNQSLADVHESPGVTLGPKVSQRIMSTDTLCSGNSVKTVIRKTTESVHRNVNTADPLSKVEEEVFLPEPGTSSDVTRGVNKDFLVVAPVSGGFIGLSSPDFIVFIKGKADVYLGKWVNSTVVESRNDQYNFESVGELVLISSLYETLTCQSGKNFHVLLRFPRSYFGDVSWDNNQHFNINLRQISIKSSHGMNDYIIAKFDSKRLVWKSVGSDYFWYRDSSSSSQSSLSKSKSFRQPSRNTSVDKSFYCDHDEVDTSKLLEGMENSPDKAQVRKDVETLLSEPHRKLSSRDNYKSAEEGSYHPDEVEGDAIDDDIFDSYKPGDGPNETQAAIPPELKNDLILEDSTVSAIVESLSTFDEVPSTVDSSFTSIGEKTPIVNEDQSEIIPDELSVANLDVTVKASLEPLPQTPLPVTEKPSPENNEALQTYNHQRTRSMEPSSILLTEQPPMLLPKKNPLSKAKFQPNTAFMDESDSQSSIVQESSDASSIESGEDEYNLNRNFFSKPTKRNAAKSVSTRTAKLSKIQSKASTNLESQPSTSAPKPAPSPSDFFSTLDISDTQNKDEDGVIDKTLTEEQEKLFVPHGNADERRFPGENSESDSENYWGPIEVADRPISGPWEEEHPELDEVAERIQRETKMNPNILRFSDPTSQRLFYQYDLYQENEDDDEHEGDFDQGDLFSNGDDDGYEITINNADEHVLEKEQEEDLKPENEVPAQEEAKVEPPLTSSNNQTNGDNVGLIEMDLDSAKSYDTPSCSGTDEDYY